MAIRLIAGLGNPGARYQRTRHNAGAEWLHGLAQRFAIPLAEERKFRALLGRGAVLGADVRLMVPTTFMNHSGDAVGAVARFFKIAPAETLVVYDEVAFPAGTSKLRVGGSDNGHNGVKSVIRAFSGDASFVRLRIGVGHPGDKTEMIGYLTGVRAPKEEQEAMMASASMGDDALIALLEGDTARAMNIFNAPNPQDSGSAPREPTLGTDNPDDTSVQDADQADNTLSDGAG